MLIVTQIWFSHVPMIFTLYFHPRIPLKLQRNAQNQKRNVKFMKPAISQNLENFEENTFSERDSIQSTMFSCAAAHNTHTHASGAKHSPPSFSSDGPFGQNPKIPKFAWHLNFRCSEDSKIEDEELTADFNISVCHVSFKIMGSNAFENRLYQNAGWGFVRFHPKTL